MRLAGIEKGGYYSYPPHMAEATAPCLSCSQQEHAGIFLTRARANPKLPASWAGVRKTRARQDLVHAFSFKAHHAAQERPSSDADAERQRFSQPIAVGRTLR